MQGQWIGFGTGAVARWFDPGATFGVLNLDKVGETYRGWLFLLYAVPGPPSIAVRIFTDTLDQFIYLTNQQVFPVDPRTSLTTDWSDLRTLYPGVTCPSAISISAHFNAGTIRLAWNTNLGTQGDLVLYPPKQDSSLQPTKGTWTEFKDKVTELADRQCIFRGQSTGDRLRTSYHRSGRADLDRYRGEDLSELLRHVSARSRHLFNFSDPEQFGAFVNLVQHHGYPTPLLDWSFSPYVAAFFAFRPVGVSKAATDSAFVRILAFDQLEWHKDNLAVLMLSCATVHLSVLKFMPIENERMVPQQAISTLTNVDDVESYIALVEARNRKRYLWAFEIPVSERIAVMKDLRQMGITAASMFPGLDGVCEALREVNF